MIVCNMPGPMDFDVSTLHAVAISIVLGRPANNLTIKQKLLQILFPTEYVIVISFFVVLWGCFLRVCVMHPSKHAVNSMP